MVVRRVGHNVVPFEQRHVEAASALAAQQLAAFRQTQPLLPGRWTAPDAFVDLLAELVGKHPAVVALVDGALVGFQAASCFEWSQGRWAFSPEWANQATGPQAGRLREEMYAALAEQWVADERRAHFVSLLPTDNVARETMAWLGFGVTNVDALRDLSPVTAARGEEVAVRRATPDDVEAVAVLEQGLRAHLAATPLFLRHPALDRADLAATLADPLRATLLATDEAGALAFLRIGPHSTDASTIIRDEGTASITRAFTRADRRGIGVASQLLDAAIGWARGAGYVRCSVDYESANLLASRFWPIHFAVVGVTYGRRLGG